MLLQVFSCMSFRKQQQLTTLQNNFVTGHIPDMPPENFLMPAGKKNTRRIHPTTFKGCDSYNTIARHKICNTCGFKIPDSKTEQYKSSFFIRTVADWNKLKTLVTVFSSSAVGRVLQGVAYHTQAEQKCFYPVFNKACTITNCTDHSF